MGKIKEFWNRSSRPGLINNKTKLQIALPFMPVQLSNALIHSAYLKYYTDVIGLDIKYMGIIYLLFGIWNALNDPMMGVFIDRFKFRKDRGKYTYILRVTAPVTLISSAMMLFAQPGWAEWVIFIFLAVLLFVFDTAQTAYSISHANYILVSAASKEERTDVSVVSNYVGQIGAFLASVIPTLLLVGETKRGLTITLFSLVLVFNSLLYYFALRPLKENEKMFKDEIQSDEGKLVDQLKNDAKSLFKSRAFITWLLFQIIGRGPAVILFTSFLYMADHVLMFNGVQATIVDLVPGLIMFLFLPLFGRWCKKIGMKKLLLIATIPLAVSYLGIYFIGNMWQALLVYSVVIVLTNVPTIVAPVMMGAIIDDDERRTGNRKAGLFTGMNALLTIPVGGLHTMIFTTILSAYSFVSGSNVQNEIAQQGIRMASSVVPAVLIFLGMIPIFFSPFSKKAERELSDFSEKKRGRNEDQESNPQTEPGMLPELS